MRIIQISDTHISREHPSRSADLEKCIQYINAVDPQPDVVVHTGDVVHDGLPQEYETARRLLDRLNAPYFVIPGNRDNRHELIKAFADGRRLRVGMDFVQYAVEDFAPRLIFADTVSLSSNKGRLCEARMTQLERMLAADTSRPTALFLHHPPFAVTVAPDPYQFESWGEVEALTDRLRMHPQVRGVFCGHVHRSAEMALGALQASTVTCVAVDLRKGDRFSDLPVFKTISIS